MKINNPLKEKLLNKIKKGEMKMRPKLYFIVRPILFVFGLIMILVFSIYFLSFIFFVFRINDGWTLMSFGFRGVLAMILSLPWGIISFILLTIVVLETLLFRFSGAYRKPVIFSLFGLIVLVLIISFLISLTAIHDSMLLRNRNQKLPWMGPFYEGYERIDFKNIHCGRILRTTESGFVIECMHDPAHMIMNVIVPDKLIGQKELKVGDVVIMAGEIRGSTINLTDLSKKNAEAFCRKHIRAERR